MGIVWQRIIIRGYTIVVKQFLVQKIAVQLCLYIPGKFALALQALGDDFLRKRPQLQMNHGAFPLQ